MEESPLKLKVFFIPFLRRFGNQTIQEPDVTDINKFLAGIEEEEIDIKTTSDGVAYSIFYRERQSAQQP